MIYILVEKKMPAVSFYIPEKVLSVLREAAKRDKTSVSRLIREAVESRLGREEKIAVKEEFLKALREADLGDWREVHRERTEESGDRG
jgi:hypothetical protein